MRKIIFLIVIILSNAFLFGQNDFNNHQKYWYLRAKLRNDFMKIGPNQGESTPFVERGYTSKVKPDNSVQYSSWTYGADLISELGIYIATLATEYELLSHNNQPTDSVIKELYYALHAVDRLDYNAESYYNHNTKKLDGFLMRDDIPYDFIVNNYEHFNYYNDWHVIENGGTSTLNDEESRPVYNVPLDNNNNDRGFLSIIGQRQWEAKSVFRDYQRLSWNKDNMLAYSQDHAISLLFGLSFVNKFIPSGENYLGKNFSAVGSSNVSLLAEARAIADRIATRFHDDAWHLKDPDDNKISNAAGGDAHAYAYAIAEAAGKIHGKPTQNINQFFNIASPIPYTDMKYHSAWSLGTGFITWQALAKSPGTTFDMVVQIAQLSAVCNCLFTKIGGYWSTLLTTIITKIWKWLGSFFGWVTSSFDEIRDVFLPLKWDETTKTSMLSNALATAPNANKDDLRIQFPQYYAIFAREILHDPNYSSQPNPYPKVKQIIDNASCEGPYDFSVEGHPSYNVWEWSGQSLIEHPNALGIAIDKKNGKLENQFNGEYNGLDYMLYHNLYYLYANPGGFVDLSSRYITSPAPFNGTIGYHGSPATRGAFEYITANNLVYASADIEYRAGKEITLKDGFEVQQGASFYANISPYNCNGQDYTNQQMRTSNASQKDSSQKEDPLASISTHTVIQKNEKVNEKKKTKSDFQPNTYFDSFVKKDVPYQNKRAININNNINVYPNPSNGQFNVEVGVSDNNISYSLFIYNNTGSLIKIFENLHPINFTISVSGNDLSSGNYVLKLLSSTGEQFSKKIIVIK